jgi:regulator of sigma E protease
MSGENPDEEVAPEDEARSFNGQSPLRRTAIAFAGPGMNWLLSIVIIAGMFMTGWPTITSRVGTVLPDSAAATAGLESGDQIVSVNGSDIWRMEELTAAVQTSGGAPLELGIKRGTSDIVTKITPTASGDGFSLGIANSAPRAWLGQLEPNGLAADAGLLPGDEVVSVNGAPIDTWSGLGLALGASPVAPEVGVKRQSAEGELDLVVTLPEREGAKDWSLGAFGADFATVQVGEVLRGKPAQRAGFAKGDVILTLDGARVTDVTAFTEQTASSGGRPLQIQIARFGQVQDLRVAGEPVETPAGGEMKTVHRIGLSVQNLSHVEQRDDVIANPVTALWRGTELTAKFTVGIINVVKMLFTRELAMNNLAGPIGIGKIAGDSLKQDGWFDFLLTMCLISVNLAILNLLPVPVLDGGHIVFAAWEGVIGSPVSIRAREIAQTVGVSLVFALIAVALWNDVTRYLGF